MARFFILAAFLALLSAVYAQCGSGSPHAVVSGSSGSYRAVRGGSTVYSGSDYRRAIQEALDSISSGQRVAVMASGSIGANSITVSSGKIFEGCGTINAGNRRGRGAIESLHTNGAQIRYLTLTGSPSFGMLFYGTRNLALGRITMNLQSGLGIRFHRDEPMNYNVTMDVINIRGASSHAVETWNIDQLQVNQVIARDVGECGLLLQRTTNARVGLVDGDNVARGTGYATFRMANENGRRGSSDYSPNVFIDRVKSRGGGRGVFCVSQSGGAVIENVDLASNGNNAILIENCYGVTIKSGTVNGGGEVRLAARTEFRNNRDISVSLRVDNTRVRESPCGTNVRWYLAGSHTRDICSTAGPYNPGSGGSSSTSCGGNNWTGPKCCSSGTCQFSNDWYSQCL
ncbi:carbohydrate-binding module family 1 protein [Parathielavia hyrcaniae]|uniref:Carbohydrate-binding module family 1 protein n=1 Tax=Parathielavia hyrcaniae TaxID=113614 RepID=A0AAN6SYL4_9PEZI|nr:carbohydrate-binding module family 1 protein [Parathielavia hyrcaniae]